LLECWCSRIKDYCVEPKGWPRVQAVAINSLIKVANSQTNQTMVAIRKHLILDQTI